MANRFNWTPEQIGDLPPDYIDELLEFLGAEADYQREQEKKAHKQSRKSGRKSSLRSRRRRR